MESIVVAKDNLSLIDIKSIVRDGWIWNSGYWVLAIRTTCIKMRDKRGCFVDVEISKNTDIPLFDFPREEFNSFVYNGGKLKINEYVELVEKVTFEGKKFYIKIKDHIVGEENSYKSEKRYIKIIEDFRSSEGNLEGCLPIDFGPRFKKQYKCKVNDEKIKRLNSMCPTLLITLFEEEKKAVDLVEQIINREKDFLLGQKINNDFNLREMEEYLGIV